MLELVISWADGAPVPSAYAVGTAVSVWRAADGAAAAYCYRRNGARHVDFPGVCSFSFNERAARVYAIASPSTNEERVIDAYRRTVVPLALQALGHEVLHASAVSMPPGVVALCGPSGVGKSTLACALSLRGHPVRADDVVALRFAGSSASILPLPFVPRLSAAARALLGTDVRPSSNEEIAGQPLAAIVSLERATASGARSGVQRISRVDAFKALFSHGLCFSQHEPSRMAVMVEHYLGLASEVPTYRATIATDLGRLPELLDGIEAALT